VKLLRLLLLGLVLPGLVSGASSSPSVVGTPVALPGSERSLASGTPLENARRAQALLGPGIWSYVIRVENTAERSRYPATVYALVFEEAGLLWFYTDTDGTQSLTLHPDRLTEEKSDIGPLLREIEPGFGAFSILADPAGGTPSGWGGALLNGCFVESLAALGERMRRGERIERARLLNCYVDTPAGRRGHTVLTYETPHGLFLLDPARSPEPRPMPRGWADNPMALAGAALQGFRVARARWVPTALPLAAMALASLETSNEPEPGAAARLMR